MGVFQLNDSLHSEQWLWQRNALIQSGSRVFIHLSKNTSIKSMPSCYYYNKSRSKGDLTQLYTPIKEFDVCCVQKDKRGLYVKYDIKKLPNASTVRQNQINARMNLLNIDSNPNIICLDMLSPYELERVLDYTNFSTEKELQLQTFLKMARKAVYREAQSNEVALQYMREIMDSITDKTDFALNTPNALDIILNDYRCSLYGREITQEVLRHTDEQKKIASLIKLRCSIHEQKSLLERIKIWLDQKAKLQIDKIGVAQNGKTFLYFREGQKYLRTVFSTNPHNTSMIGKPVPIDENDFLDSYMIPFSV